MRSRIFLVIGISATTILSLMSGCESEPQRKDVRVDPQRIDVQRIDAQRQDKMLPMWNAPKEKSWWEW